MKLVTTFTSITLVLCGFSLTTVQQVNAAAIEEIVVTARKRSESLQDVPIAITAFTETTIQQAGIERPNDFITLIPNVTLVNSANVGDTQVSIRGIVSTRDAESTFAYVVDGVLNTNPNSFNEELVDIQQIEVLKGPQGALYGRNAVAGAILVTTKKPGDEATGKVKVSAGTQGTVKYSGTYSGPISDTLSGSISYSHREQDGFYSNDFTGADDSVDYLDDDTGRLRLVWDASDDLSFDFKAGYSEVSGGAINFNAAFAIPAFVDVFGSPTFNADVNDLDFVYAFNVPGLNEQETTDLSLRMDYAASFGDVTASVTYNNLDEFLLSDGTSATFYGYELTPQCQADRATLNSFARPDLFGELFQPFGVLPPGEGNDFVGVYGPYTPTSCDGYQYQERNQNDVSAEFRVLSNTDGDLRWLGGAYTTSIDREVVVAYGADQGLGFELQPYVGPNGLNPTDLLFWDDFDTDVYALFGQLEYDVTDTVELAVALRYDREERTVSNRVPNVTASGLNINTLDANFQPGPINPGFSNNPDGIPSRSRDFDQLQPKVTVNWAATENTNIYASYGIGFRSGGFNSLGSSDLLNFFFNTGFGGPGEAVDAQLVINDEYDKEVSTNIELGLKTSLFDNRLSFNAALFNTDVDDNQFFEFFAGPFGLLRVVTTIEEIQIRGFEGDFNFAASDYISIFGGFGFIDSEIQQNINRPLSVGNDVPQAPDRTFNLGASLEIPFGRDKFFFARADWQYVGKTWFHTLQGEQTPTIWQAFFGPGFLQDFTNSQRDAYDTLNLRLGIETDNWAITAYGRNITDNDYLEEIIPAPEFGGSFNHQSAGDGYGLEVTYSF
ncbi:TonB-dependent receptor [Arenicella sp.]|nr:TonB-dependent receptor [Arenicella sp.]